MKPAMRLQIRPFRGLSSRTTTRVAAAAGDKVSKLRRIKKAQVASVSVGRDYDKLFDMIANLGRKIQVIGEIVERELVPTQREDPMAPTPPR